MKIYIIVASNSILQNLSNRSSLSKYILEHHFFDRLFYQLESLKKTLHYWILDKLYTQEHISLTKKK